MTDVVTALRAFNRFHTRFVGALQPRFMGGPQGLTAARMLYEIAQKDDMLASTLQDRLGLDAGYVSRVLRGFEKQGWIVRARGDDARRRPIRLTADGRAAFDMIDARAHADVTRSTAHLSKAEQRDLIAALALVRTLLEPSGDEGI